MSTHFRKSLFFHSGIFFIPPLDKIVNREYNYSEVQIHKHIICSWTALVKREMRISNSQLGGSI